MTASKIIGLGVVLLLSIKSVADLPKDPAEYEKWESQMLAAIKSQEGLPHEASIPKLGKWVKQMSLPNNREMGPRTVFRSAQAALLAVPGHAEYFATVIRNKTEEELALKDDARQRMWAYETLEQLPSSETVNVLGELLYDNRDPGAGRDFYDTGPPIPNFKRASMALTQLGIRKPPVKNQYPGRSGFEVEEVETWKIWYEQVRDGTRTFSFEGDDAIYNLSGRTTVEKDGPMRSRPDRKPPSPDMEERDKGGSSIGRTPVIIAVLLVIGIVFFTIQQMRKRTA